MNKLLIASLKKERDLLLTRWIKASQKEKLEILFRIMEIDEILKDSIPA